MRFLLGLPLLALCVAFLAEPQASKPSVQFQPVPGKFVDLTSSLGLRFQYVASHTSRQYLPETMRAGVALFDYDYDGKLDIFIVNSAPLSNPTRKGTIPQKTGPQYWNHLCHQKTGATVKLTTASGSQFATVTTADSYLSFSDNRVHFGLASESAAHSV